MIFEFIKYQDYILHYIARQPQKGRGLRVRMADHLKCKTSFVSQVLNGDQNFSVEQAFLMNGFLAHDEAESKYFLALVQAERAGNKALKDYFKKEAGQIRTEFLRLKNRVKADLVRSKEDEFRYFSSADYGYVHILITIPEFQTKQALLQKLNFKPKYLEKILDYLLKLGYVVYRDGRYLPGPSFLHVPDDASIISTHHTNWRIQTIKSCQSPGEQDLHYSSVISISEEDFFRIKSLLVQELEVCRQIIKASPSEKPYSLCLDLFEMK